jgi:hypothetical protein
MGRIWEKEADLGCKRLHSCGGARLRAGPLLTTSHGESRMAG